MLLQIQELVDQGFHFECGAHRDDVGFYAIFDRRKNPKQEDYHRALTLDGAIQEAYDLAKQWMNS